MGLAIIILSSFTIGFIVGATYLHAQLQNIGFKFKYDNGKWYRDLRKDK